MRVRPPQPSPVKPETAAYALRLYEKGYTISQLATLSGVTVTEMKAALDVARRARG